MKRVEYIDAIAGVMILWMMFRHLQQVTDWYMDYPNILFFFMPWFYYKAGALSKERTLREVANIGGGQICKTIRDIWTSRTTDIGSLYADRT